MFNDPSLQIPIDEVTCFLISRYRSTLTRKIYKMPHYINRVYKINLFKKRLGGHTIKKFSLKYLDGALIQLISNYYLVIM